ncbi:MAG: sulfatase/phosphatase domain-containing protein [Bryobacteraceae bacterium]
MPRNKRWPYNSGLRVPLIVHVPGKFRHLAPNDYRPGAASTRLVSFVDLAPTLLSLIGLEAPEWMQGRAFLGEHPGRERESLHGFRGRMDERYDMVRSVRDQRYVYVRNYLPHLIYGQHLAYMFETPTTQVWKRLYDEGKLKPPQSVFWEPKPAEELYDLETDPDEVNNLAGSARHRSVLERLRAVQQDHAFAVRDVGFLPEDEIHSRSMGSTPYEVGHDDRRYPMARIMAAAELASSLQDGATSRLAALLGDSDSAVRYWGATGILARGPAAVAETRPALRKTLADAAPSVRTVAAQALGQYGGADDVNAALPVLVRLADCRRNPLFVAVRALNALDALGARVKPAADAIRALPVAGESVDARIREYPGRLLKEILPKL